MRECGWWEQGADRRILSFGVIGVARRAVSRVGGTGNVSKDKIISSK